VRITKGPAADLRQLPSTVKVRFVVGASPIAEEPTQPTYFEDPIMNTAKTLIAIAISCSAIGSAVAQEAGSDAWMNAQGSKSRAQVQAELAQARTDGSLRTYGRGYIPSVKSSASRAEVVAALRAARASGEFDRLHAEAWQAGGERTFDTDTRVAMSR
jgi:hypothetical protein